MNEINLSSQFAKIEVGFFKDALGGRANKKHVLLWVLLMGVN